MNDIGEFTLLVALATAIYGCVAYVMAARGNRIDLYLSADKTPLIVWGCVMISSICLWRAFLVNDFSLQYVWAYSNIELDTFYKIASFWGGQKGFTFVLDATSHHLHSGGSLSEPQKKSSGCSLCDGRVADNNYFFSFPD